jgi:hypothetical protein
VAADDFKNIERYPRGVPIILKISGNNLKAIQRRIFGS